MGQLIFGKGMGSQLGSGMAIVIAAGLLYATLMTLFIIPVMYDILFKKPPLNVQVDGSIDEVPDDAAEYLAEHAEGGGVGDGGSTVSGDDGSCTSDSI